MPDYRVLYCGIQQGSFQLGVRWTGDDADGVAFLRRMHALRSLHCRNFFAPRGLIVLGWDERDEKTRPLLGRSYLVIMWYT